MTSKSIFSSGAVFLLTALASPGVLLFSVIDPSGVPAGNRALGGFTIGQEFTVGASPLLVTALGFEDAGLDGLSGASTVGVWDLSGALVASAVVPAGEGGRLVEAWRFQDLATSVILEAGTTYRVGGSTANEFVFTDTTNLLAGQDGVADFAISADATSPAAPNRFDAGFTNPATNGGDLPLRWALGNIEYTVIPEVGSTTLLGMMSIVSLFRRRRSA